MNSDITFVRGSKKKAKKSNVFLYIVIILTALLALLAIWLKFTWDEIFLQLPGERGGVVAFLGTEKERSLSDIMNVLILGLDTRDAAARADTIMLCR